MNPYRTSRTRYAWGPAPRRPRHSLQRGRRRDESGLTLVELMVSMAVMLIIITMTSVIISNFFSNENQLSASYSAFAQVLPGSTSLQGFFRTLTEPAPTAASGVPVPAFTPVSSTPASALQGPFNISPNSATFTSDLGNADGPSLITATTTANASPAGTYTFTVTVAPPNANTCPGTGAGLGGTGCTWGAASRAFQITDLTNGAVTAGLPTNPPPIFQYTLAGSSTPVPYSTTAGSPWVTDFGSGSCTSTACPITLIQTVTIDLEVRVPGGNPASYQTLVSALAPYYSKYVG